METPNPSNIEFTETLIFPLRDRNLSANQLQDGKSTWIIVVIASSGTL